MSVNGSGEIELTELSIEERSGAIVIMFGENYMILPPKQAMEVGKILVQYGYHAETGQEQAPERVMSEQIKNKLLQRLSLVIKNMNDQQRKPMYMANEVMDIVLREVM
jgi:hypothetical protein